MEINTEIFNKSVKPIRAETKAETKSKSSSTVFDKIINVVTVLFLAFALFLLAGPLLGFNSYVVLTNSMSPTFNEGGWILVQNRDVNQIKEGDILTFTIKDQPDTVLTHRVREVVEIEGERQFITRGDANNTDDVNPVSQDRIIGVAILWINGMGTFMEFLKTPNGMIVLGAIFIVLMVVPSLIKLIRNK